VRTDLLTHIQTHTPVATLCTQQNLMNERKAAQNDRRMSFELTGLDMLRLRPFRRMVREKVLRMRQRGTIHPGECSV
jgi:hypothetical protein